MFEDFPFLTQSRNLISSCYLLSGISNKPTVLSRRGIQWSGAVIEGGIFLFYDWSKNVAACTGRSQLLVNKHQVNYRKWARIFAGVHEFAMDQWVRSTDAIRPTMTLEIWFDFKMRSELRQWAQRFICLVSQCNLPFWAKLYFATHHSLDSLRRSHWLIHRAVCGKIYARSFPRV